MIFSKFKVFSLFIVIFSLFLLLSVGSLAQVTIPRNETVYCIGDFWGPVTSFNLYSPTVAGKQDYVHLMYLPLFLYNSAKDLWLPLIGESYQVVNKTTLRVKIRPQAKWSDGVPITADDVVYSFNLTKKLGTGPGVGWDTYISSIKAIDDKTVEFRMKQDNVNYYAFIAFAFGGTQSFAMRIVPKHVYSELEKKGVNISDWPNDEPEKQVVSGPYKVYFSDPNAVIFGRIDNWWGKDIFGLPKPKYVAHIIYKDNAGANLAFEKGDADWGSTFIPEVYALWEKKGLPIRTWFKSEPYYMPNGVNFLYISYAQTLLKDPQVRKAIALAIPYKDMLKKAYFGYSDQAHPSFVIDVFESYQQWIDSNYFKFLWKTKDGKIPTDIKTANKILDDLGYKKGPDGIRVAPNGKRMGPFTIQVPYGWTDWMVMCEMIAKNLREIGLEVKTDFPDFTVWFSRLLSGTFDFVISWDGGPGFDHPWNTYRFTLDPRITGPIGQEFPAGNWQRYNNPAVTKLLDIIPATLDVNARKAAISKLQRIVAGDMPAIPLFYGAHWYAFNESYWIGWPREENPWWFPAAVWSTESLPVLFGIAKKGETHKVPSWFSTVDKGGILFPTSTLWNALMTAKTK
jgi:peptide/nickel transport system substrate-binding protein